MGDIWIPLKEAEVEIKPAGALINQLVLPQVMIGPDTGDTSVSIQGIYPVGATNNRLVYLWPGTNFDKTMKFKTTTYRIPLTTLEQWASIYDSTAFITVTGNLAIENNQYSKEYNGFTQYWIINTVIVGNQLTFNVNSDKTVTLTVKIFYYKLFINSTSGSNYFVGNKSIDLGAQSTTSATRQDYNHIIPQQYGLLTVGQLTAHLGISKKQLKVEQTKSFLQRIFGKRRKV